MGNEGVHEKTLNAWISLRLSRLQHILVDVEMLACSQLSKNTTYCDEVE